MLNHPLLTLTVFLLTSPMALATVMLLALIPFFLLGLTGRLWWAWQLRQMRRGDNPFRGTTLFDIPPEKMERTLWHQETESLAEIITGSADKQRHTG